MFIVDYRASHNRSSYPKLLDEKMKIFLACLLLQEFTFRSFLQNDIDENYIPELRPCYVYEPGFLQCLKTQANLVINLVQDGNGTLRIPPLNPFYIHYLPLPLRRTFTLELTKIYIYGLTDGTLSNFRLNETENSAHIQWYFANLYIKCRYRLNGEIFKTNITTAGPLNITVYELITDITVPYKPVKKIKRAHYYSDIDMSVAMMNLMWGSDYPNDDALLYQISDKIKNKWEVITREYKIPLGVAMRNILLPMIDRIIDHVEINKLIPLQREHGPGDLGRFANRIFG